MGNEWLSGKEGKCRWKKVTCEGFLEAGSFAGAVNFIFAMLGDGR
jgi:hypothetical protein